MTIDELLLKGEALSGAPQVACKLNSLLKKEAFTQEIVEVAQYDPGLTARILHICNTPFYRPRNGISTLQEAINRLGFDTIIRLVWKISMASQMGGSLGAYNLEAGGLWRHSITTAIAAEELWKLSKFQEDIEVAYTAALLHDVGKILTNVAITSDADSFHQLVKEDGMPAHHAESAVLGFNHAEVGGQLLLKWGQEESLISAVVHHHNPGRAIDERFATLICAANQCAHLHEDILQRKKGDASAVADTLNALEIDISRLEILMQAIEKRRAEVEVFMSLV